jgi:alpha-tubulin suppressor-like RCC1 family protein
VILSSFQLTMQLERDDLEGGRLLHDIVRRRKIGDLLQVLREISRSEIKLNFEDASEFAILNSSLKWMNWKSLSNLPSRDSEGFSPGDLLRSSMKSYYLEAYSAFKNIGNYVPHPPRFSLETFSTIEAIDSDLLSYESTLSTKIWSLGKGSYYQLGYPGVTSIQSTPKEIQFENVRVVETAASKHTSAFITDIGELFMCGRGYEAEPQMTPSRLSFFSKQRLKVASIHLGLNHCIAVSSTGVAYAWGSNKFGALGVGSSIDSSPTPIRVDGVLKKHVIVSAAVGEYHSLLVDSDGGVYSFGCNFAGQLGQNDVQWGPVKKINDTIKSNQFQSYKQQHASKSDFPKKVKAEKVYASDNYSLILSIDGEVWMCGHGTPEWRKILFDSLKAKQERQVAEYRIASFAGGFDPGDIVASAKVLSSVGFDMITITSDETSQSNAFSEDRERVSESKWQQSKRGLSCLNAKITYLAASKTHALALDSEGYVWMFGEAQDLFDVNDYRPLNGVQKQSRKGESNSLEPNWYSPSMMLALALGNVHVKAVSCAANSSAVVSDHGFIYTWGNSNFFGGKITRIPRLVSSICNVGKISLADDHCVITTISLNVPLPPLLPTRSEIRVLSCFANVFYDSIHDSKLESMSDSEVLKRIRIKIPDGLPAFYLNFLSDEVVGAVSSKTDTETYPVPNMIKMEDDFSSSLSFRVVPSLKSLCERVIASSLTISTVPLAVKVAFTCNANGLGSACAEWINRNVFLYLQNVHDSNLDYLIDSFESIQDGRWIASDSARRQFDEMERRRDYVKNMHGSIERCIFEVIRPRYVASLPPRQLKLPEKLHAIVAREAQMIRSCLFDQLRSSYFETSSHSRSRERNFTQKLDKKASPRQEAPTSAVSSPEKPASTRPVSPKQPALIPTSPKQPVPLHSPVSPKQSSAFFNPPISPKQLTFPDRSTSPKSFLLNASSTSPSINESKSNATSLKSLMEQDAKQSEAAMKQKLKEKQTKEALEKAKRESEEALKSKIMNSLSPSTSPLKSNSTPVKKISLRELQQEEENSQLKRQQSQTLQDPVVIRPVGWGYIDKPKSSATSLKSLMEQDAKQSQSVTKVIQKKK